jgi:hypothetical protein
MSTAFEPVAVGHHRDTYFAPLDALNSLGLAHLSIAEGPDTELSPLLRQRWTGTVIPNPFTPRAYTGPEAVKLVESGVADLVSHAALSPANPDLTGAAGAGGPFNTPDHSKAHGGDHVGDTDYPTLLSDAEETVMKAVTFVEFGDAEVLHGADVPQPVPGPGQIRIRVGAASVNPLDGQIRSSAAQAYFPTPLPAVLGFEVAGVVAALGEGVTGVAVGDRVVG